MQSRHGARLVALLAPVALLLPAAAHAEKVVTEDAAGDVLQSDLASELDSPEWAPATEETSTDIVRTVAAYGDTRLSVTVHFRDLLNTRYQETFVKILTPRGSYTLGAARFPGTRIGTSISRGRGGEVECRGLRAKFDGGADTDLRLRPGGVPRRRPLGAARGRRPRLRRARRRDAGDGAVLR